MKEEKKELNLRIIVPAIIVIVVIIGIVVFNSNQSTSENKGKGTRDNPYKIGDTIEITDIYDLYATSDSNKNVPFNATITLEEVYTAEQGISKRKSEYDKFTTVPIAKVSFEVNGNYDDKLNYDEIFKISYIDENMEEKSYVIENDKQEQIGTIYTGNKYTANLLCKHDNETDEVDTIKYFVIEYRDKNSNSHSIYIEPVESSDDAINVENNIETNYDNAIKLIDNEEYSKAYEVLQNISKDYKDNLELRNYCKGMIFYKDYQCYGYALDYFAKCEDTLNTKDIKNEIMEIVSKYNGTYYYDSPKYPNKNLGIYMCVKDGKVGFQYKSSYTNGVSISYSYSLISKYNEETKQDELLICNFFADKPETSNYEFLWYELPDGGITISGRTNTTAPSSYSGIYDKESNEPLN